MYVANSDAADPKWVSFLLQDNSDTDITALVNESVFASRDILRGSWDYGLTTTQGTQGMQAEKVNAALASTWVPTDLAVDQRGHVFAMALEGVLVLAPNGTLLGVVDIPVQQQPLASDRATIDQHTQQKGRLALGAGNLFVTSGSQVARVHVPSRSN